LKVFGWTNLQTEYIERFTKIKKKKMSHTYLSNGTVHIPLFISYILFGTMELNTTEYWNGHLGGFILDPLLQVSS